MLTHSRQILIVEDSPEDREIFRQYLDEDLKNAYTFCEVATGEKGLESFKVKPPDCILLDYRLPDMDGLEFLSELRNKTNGNNPFIPVVMLTGYGDEKIAVLAMKNGVSDYLVKDDLYPEQLQWAIANALEKSELQLKLEEQRQELSQKNGELENLNGRLSGILESIMDGFFALDKDCCFTYFNQKTLQLLGQKPEELCGKNLWEILPGVVGKDFCQELRKTALDKIGVEFEAFIPKLNCWLAVRVHSSQNGYSVYFYDITSRKQTEERLRLLERALASSNNGVLITDQSQPDNPLIYVNAGFEQITGYELQEVIGRNCRFLQNEDQDQPALTEIRAALQQERECTVTLRNYRKDGSLFWNELHLAPVPNTEGRVTHFVGVQIDVTQRKHAEETLRKWASVFEHAHWGVAIANPTNDTFEVVNPAFAQMHGYEVAELVGKPIALIFAPKEQSKLPERIQQIHVQGREIYESVHQRKDGSTFPVLFDVMAVKDETGKVLYRVANVQDITWRKQMEEQLRASEQLHRTLIENAPDVISRIDRQFRYVYSNREPKRTPDITTPNHPGYTVRELGLPEDFCQAWENKIQEVFQTRQEIKAEYSIPFPSGLTHYQTQLVPEFSLDGSVESVLAISRNITELKQAQLALQTSEQLHRTLIENSPDVVCRVDPQLRYAYINQAVERATGLAVSNYIGHSVRELGLPEEFCQRWDSRIQEVFQTGQEITVEYSLPLPAGMTHYQTRLVPEFSEEGSVESVLAISRDITDLKQTQLALQVSEARFQAILNNAPIAIYLRDLNGRFLFANQWIRTHFRFDENTYQGQSVYKLFPQDNGDVWLTNDRKVLEAGVAMEFEETRTHSDGPHQYLSIKFPLFNTNGQPYAICGISTDISERKHAEEERQQLLAREQFARQQAQVAALRTAQLQAVTAALSQALTPTEVAEIVIGQGMKALGAPIGSLYLLTPSGQEVELIKSIGWVSDEDVKRWKSVSIDAPLPAVETTQTGSLVVVESLEEWQQRYPLVASITASDLLGSLVVVPVQIEGYTLGAISLHFKGFPKFNPEDHTTMLTLGQLCGQALERARLYEAEQLARQQAQAAALRTARLQVVTAALSQALTPAEVAKIVVSQGLEVLGAYAGVICLLTPSGQEVEILNSIGYSDEEVKRWKPLSINTPVPLTQAIRTGSLILVESLEERQLRYPLITLDTANTELGGLAAIPLESERHTIGVIGLSFKGFPKFSPEDRATMVALGQLCAQALERTRLYEAERQARQEAELAQQRLTLLAEVSIALTSSLDYETILNEIFRLKLLGLADWCFVTLIEEDGIIKRLATTHCDPAKEPLLQQMVECYPVTHQQVLNWIEYPQAAVFPEIADSFLEVMASDADHLQLLRALDPKSGMKVPLIVRNKTIGTLGFWSSRPNYYQTGDLSLAQEIALRIALALENTWLYRQAQALGQAQAELNQLKDLYLSVASHELKAPLTAAKGYVQILQRGLLKQLQNHAPSEGDPSAQAFAKNLRSIETILYQLDRMNGLINTLHSFSSIQNGKLELNYAKDADLLALIARVVEQQQQTTTDHSLIIQTKESTVTGSYDEARLEQVLTNLISNAIKYSPSNTTVTVGIEYNQADSDSSEAIIWVRDQGYGIGPEDQAHIFEQFYRARSQETSKVVGLGLGLYISHQIVVQHSGRMWLESQVGEGTTFYFSIPVEVHL
jgi:PAS domain S-box-containing protein